MITLNVQEIQEIIPHRYPFLLVDRVLELEPMKKGVGIKNVTMNEAHFMGHFPNEPIMPGVLLIEAMAQVGGIAMLYPAENRGKIAYFTGIDKVKFRKLGLPEIQRYVEVEQPLMCAGSFKCESLGISLFEQMIGQDQTTLMGMPMIQLCHILRELKVLVP